MKIRDIVNRELVNLTNCDQEPIHIPGSIQPHGFLLALNDTFQVGYCSANVLQHLGIGHEKILDKNLRDIIDATGVDMVTEYLEQRKAGVTAPLILPISANNYQCFIHRSGPWWIAEFEPIATTIPVLSTVYDQTVHFVNYMKEAETLQSLCATVAREIRKLTGYDRVMIYRFDKDYNGEVYAESKRDDLEAFLGLHYPHTDIPVQARQLYIKNLLRLIVDVNYEPVPIFTIDDADDKNLDLGLSVLRSVSPIHIQYLQNMGVGATLTISLLHEGRLWGLIACHHYSPKYIDHYTRINAQLQGHFLTSQINVRQLAEEYAIAREVNDALENLLNRSFLPNRSSLQDIIMQPALLKICNAQGVAILLDGQVYKNGHVPADEQIMKIAAWADEFSNQTLYITSKLCEDYNGGNECATHAAGIIFYALRSLQAASIIWFNPETLEEVSWAGDPEKAIEKNENGLSPRKSFEAWKQVIQCQARDWAAPELTAAANFAYALQKHVTLILLTEEEGRQRELTNKLKESNEELENISWISSHDLREPLRKIRLFSSRLLSNGEGLSDDVSDTLKRMNESAARMQNMIEGLTMYARARHAPENYSPIDLNTTLQQIIGDLGEEIEDAGASILIENLPVINGIGVLVHQLFINLVGNALKFSKKDEAPVIRIFCAAENVSKEDYTNRFYKISVSDNGIGFDQEFEDTVFKIFSRLNNANEYRGSGIGLALCKKIMQIHHGTISADSTLNEGTTFNLFFPMPGSK